MPKLTFKKIIAYNPHDDFPVLYYTTHNGFVCVITGCEKNVFIENGQIRRL